MRALRRLKARIFPNLVINRAPLDAELQRLLDRVAKLELEKSTVQQQYDALKKTPPAVNTYHFKGYNIPIRLMLMTGGGPETFDTISDNHNKLLHKKLGIEPQHNILEIGCGIGRDAIPLSYQVTEGSYLGIDIIGDSIEWCKHEIGARNPNFQFLHFNVEDKLHNVGGVTKTTDIILPIPDRSIDRIFLFSVFTHLYQSDIEHYLREFRRVLKPGGIVLATTFIYDNNILKKARETNRTAYNLRFEHQLDDGCRINDVDQPLGAIAFTQDRWDKMIKATGMKYAHPILFGGWSGFFDTYEDGQDVLILEAAGS